MLVLTRKHGEKIRIGNDITITVVDIGKARVKLGIEAPAGHRILRSELIVQLESATDHDDAPALSHALTFDEPAFAGLCGVGAGVRA